jgi:hypothetical protein
MSVVYSGPYLRTGQRGPGPGRQISRGGILKNSRLMRGKTGCPRERNLREIYTENTMFCLLSVFCVVFLLHVTEYEHIRGAAKFSWAQGRKIPKYGPASITLNLYR